MKVKKKMHVTCLLICFGLQRVHRAKKNLTEGPHPDARSGSIYCGRLLPMVILPLLFAVQPEGDNRRPGWWAALWGVAAVTALAMALFAATFFRGRERDLGQELTAAREQLRGQTLQLTRFNEAFAILNGPDTAAASFGKGQPRTSNGKVFVSPSQGVLLVASNLPPAAAGKIYAMWLLPKSGMPAPAGLFQSATDGTALHVYRGGVDPGGVSAVAVTLENEGGSPQPTSQPLIVVRPAASEPRPQESLKK